MKGKCFCPLAEAEEGVQESDEEQEEEVVEGPPPVEMMVRAAQRPALVSQRGETDTVSPQIGATIPDHPARVRKKVSKFLN